jgi:hypothetical protein
MMPVLGPPIRMQYLQQLAKVELKWIDPCPSIASDHPSRGMWAPNNEESTSGYRGPPSTEPRLCHFRLQPLHRNMSGSTRS